MEAKFHFQLSPLRLFTYETASARDRILEIEHCNKLVEDFVNEHFGRNKFDNKITIECRTETGKLVYLTYWDGKLSIGSSVYFFADYTKPENEYRKVLPLNLQPE